MSAARGFGAKFRVALLPLALASACADRAGPKASTGPLPPGVLAEVGADAIHAETVARIARAQGISPAEARERAVSDALFAAAARAEGTAAPRVVDAERSVLARAVLERVRDEARAKGPPSDDEVRTFTEQRWVELDRPASVRTTHAVVLFKSAADEPAARALADTLAKALTNAANSAEFIRRAEAVPKGTLDIRAERLPPVTVDGRLWDADERPPKPLNGTLDLDFTRAAHTLTAVGAQTAVVKTAFGYHVIELDERYPEARFSLEDRRALLAPDVYSRRAKRELEALSTRLHAVTPVTTERAMDALTALVPVTP